MLTATPPHRISLLSSGNFSFALSLLGPPHSHPPSQILATAYDTESECYRKYPDAQANVERIRAIAGRKEVVVFGVDAGNLAASKAVTGGKQAVKEFAMDSGEAGLRRWSKVWFGFPHVGE